jgi:hypothetical protein
MQNKLELVDKDSYYRAFDKWLEHTTYNLKDQKQMDELWLKFSNDLGIELGLAVNDRFLINIIDSLCWKEAKKYYSLISFRTELSTTENS